MRLTVEVRREHDAFPLQYRVIITNDARRVLFEKGDLYPALTAQDTAYAYVAEVYQQSIVWEGRVGQDKPGNLVYRG